MMRHGIKKLIGCGVMSQPLCAPNRSAGGKCHKEIQRLVLGQLMQDPRADDLRPQAGFQNIDTYLRQRMKVEDTGGMDDASESRHGMAKFREELGHGCKISYITGNDCYRTPKIFNRPDLQHRFVAITFGGEVGPRGTFRQSSTTYEHQVSCSPLRHPMRDHESQLAQTACDQVRTASNEDSGLGSDPSHLRFAVPTVRSPPR
jgi:hypothetical protein